MTEDFIVYTVAALIVIIVFLALFGLITAEVRLLFWLFGM